MIVQSFKKPLIIKESKTTKEDIKKIAESIYEEFADSVDSNISDKLSNLYSISDNQYQFDYTNKKIDIKTLLKIEKTFNDNMNDIIDKYNKKYKNDIKYDIYTYREDLSISVFIDIDV